MSTLKSMTAYGRGAKRGFIVEIQSVNRRFLEVNVTLPRLLARFEMLIRKKIAQKVKRGMVNVLVNWQKEPENLMKITPNLSLAKEVKRAWEQIAFELGLEAKIELPLLAYEKELFVVEEAAFEETSFQEELAESLDEALTHLLMMKEKEGEHLFKDLMRRADTLEKIIADIETRSPQLPEKMRQKLTERLGEWFSGSPEQEERIMREVALYAERMDVTEEMIRLKSHVQQFRHMTQGKALDFLIQELNREINTIGSKASDLTITQLVVAAKGELEKMREQVQNVE